MSDKYLMENIMFGSKVISDLYLHGVIESTTDKVNNTFFKSLMDVLKLHTEIFKEMENTKIYTIQKVNENKIKEKKKSLECECNNCLGEEN